MIAAHFRLEGSRDIYVHMISGQLHLALTGEHSSVSHTLTYDEAQAIGLALVAAVQDQDEQLPT